MACDPVSFLASGKADTRWLQAIDPWLSPGLGKADTRLGERHRIDRLRRPAPERIFARARESARRMQPAGSGHDHRWQHTDARGAAGAIHAALDAGSGGRCVHRASFPARRKTCSGAAYYKRLIRGLPPSACLPFQARGKAPDQSLAASAQSAFPSSGNGTRSAATTALAVTGESAATAPTATAGTARCRAAPRTPAGRSTRPPHRSRTAAGS